jgi:hypothetical protein
MLAQFRFSRNHISLNCWLSGESGSSAVRRGPSSLPRERRNVHLIGRLTSASVAKPVGSSRQTEWPATLRQPGIGRAVKLDRKPRPVQNNFHYLAQAVKMS